MVSFEAKKYFFRSEIGIYLGSHEFYSHRAEITKRLIQEKVFSTFSERLIL